MEIIKIGSGIFGSNVFVIGTLSCCVIVDAGAEVGAVKSAVGSRKVLALFLTHGHYDHVCGADAYAKAFGCKIYAHKNAKTYFENSQINASGGVFELHDFSDFVFFDCDMTFNF